MAEGLKISALPLHSVPLDGTEQLVFVVNGVTKRVASSALSKTSYGDHETATATISLDVMTSLVANATGSNVNVTLPNGSAAINGMLKVISADVLNASVTITTADGIGFTDIVLTNTGNGVLLQYLNGWRIIGKNIG